MHYQLPLRRGQDRPLHARLDLRRDHRPAAAVGHLHPPFQYDADRRRPEGDVRARGLRPRVPDPGGRHSRCSIRCRRSTSRSTRGACAGTIRPSPLCGRRTSCMLSERDRRLSGLPRRRAHDVSLHRRSRAVHVGDDRDDAPPSAATSTWFSEDVFRAILRLRGMEANAPSRHAEAVLLHEDVAGLTGQPGHGAGLAHWRKCCRREPPRSVKVSGFDRAGRGTDIACRPGAGDSSTGFSRWTRCNTEQGRALTACLTVLASDFNVARVGHAARYGIRHRAVRRLPRSSARSGEASPEAPGSLAGSSHVEGVIADRWPRPVSREGMSRRLAWALLLLVLLPLTVASVGWAQNTPGTMQLRRRHLWGGRDCRNGHGARHAHRHQPRQRRHRAADDDQRHRDGAGRLPRCDPGPDLRGRRDVQGRADHDRGRRGGRREPDRRPDPVQSLPGRRLGVIKTAVLTIRDDEQDCSSARPRTS